MTEAELVAAFQGQITLTNQLFFGYVSLMSGFLVMSYLVASRISLLLASIAVVLFSIVSVLLTLGILLNQNDAQATMSYMLEQSTLGNLDMAWLGSNPAWAGQIMSLLYMAATIGGYFACVAYFFYSRRVRRIAA
jgi:hypothetical protein